MITLIICYFYLISFLAIPSLLLHIKNGKKSIKKNIKNGKKKNSLGSYVQLIFVHV